MRSIPRLDAARGILRLAPTWVPRSFLMPGRRLKLRPQDLYALGTHRGGIDERWFASTTPAANEGAPPDEGLSYVVHDGERLHAPRRHRAARRRDDRRGDLGHVQAAGRSTASSSTTWGRSPTTCTRTTSRPPWSAARGSPESYYFPPQLNCDRQQLPLHLLRPGAGHDQGGHPPLPGALERGRQRHPRTTPRPIASSPAPAGWCRPACCTPPARW